MASLSLSKVPYFRLRNELDGFEKEENEEKVSFKKIRKWYKFRKTNGRRKPRIIIPGLRKFLRKRGRYLSRFRVSLAKVLRRLKNGQAHMNDLFGRNFLLMQPSPNPFICGNQRPYLGSHALHEIAIK